MSDLLGAVPSLFWFILGTACLGILSGGMMRRDSADANEIGVFLSVFVGIFLLTTPDLIPDRKTYAFTFGASWIVGVLLCDALREHRRRHEIESAKNDDNDGTWSTG